jgi:hypothetical protein
VRGFLPFLAKLPMDGVEALTPLPQGDVTLEEIRDHIGGKILLDGIPALLFLKTYTRAQLEDCVRKLVDYFHPRLILGISDELPMAAGPEAIDRLKWIVEFCEHV